MKHKYSPKSDSKNRWKIVILVLVICTAAGVAAYSFLSRQNNMVGSTSTGFNPTAAVNGKPASATSGPAAGDLNWVKNMSTEFVDHDFVFVMFPGNNNELNAQAAKSITSASSKIQAEGIKIDSLSLKQDDPEIATTIEMLAISKLPAVIAYNRNGGGALATGDITENQLLQAYLMANQACTPGGSCCPTK